jgi:signal transduction histidine kinase
MPLLGARTGEWFAAHRQRLAYLLVALALAVVVGAATAAGVLLHRAAVIERQALRTQQLGSAAFELQNVVAQAQTGGGFAGRAHGQRALRAAAGAYARVRSHDRAAGERISASYAAYVRASRLALRRGSAQAPVARAGEQRRLERRLAVLESRVDGEIARLARASRVTNPRARLLLLVAAAAAAMLVALLIWQFEMQRRAGRIDRDNARRSEELNRLKDQFVASVSHELRTPLTSILGYLDLVKDSDHGRLTSEESAYLEIVARNAERLLLLVSDLLLVAEVESGTLALRLSDVELGALAADCAEAAKPDADGKDISLALVCEGPARLMGDPARLAQMMDNLVTNAIKFTPVGGRVIVRTSGSDGTAVFEVRDTGPGIAKADQPQLFDAFFRSQAAVTASIKGTGLGLTITKAIIDAHHGVIGLESALGSGTTFRIELPSSAPTAPARSSRPGVDIAPVRTQ